MKLIVLKSGESKDLLTHVMAWLRERRAERWLNCVSLVFPGKILLIIIVLINNYTAEIFMDML